MKVTLEKDEKCNVDITLCESLLNTLCTSISFFSFSVRPLNKRHSAAYIDFSGESDRIQRLLSGHDSDHHFLLTRRPFADNYFTHQSGSTTVLSLANWQEYTSLPEENGFLHMIARYLLVGIEDLDHAETTGCVFDFHWDKPGIDFCMKQGRICSRCNAQIQNSLKRAPRNKALYKDALTILHAVANTSRLGRSVYTILTDANLQSLNWQTFEDYVADYYRTLGAGVEQCCNLAGFQVDIVATETTASGHEVRTAIECKFHKNRVGNRLVNDFARVFATIRDAGLADAAVLVSYAGFTQDARLAGRHAGVDLVHYKDISRKMEHSSWLSRKTSEQQAIEEPRRKVAEDRRVFVIMPFSSDLDDLYFFGVQDAVKENGGVCVRMDQEQFNGGILEQIYENIECANIVVAEVTRPNANVYYEVGYAHALRREVVLLTHDISATPFDLAGFNHIVYSNIRDLRDKLGKRLAVLLKQKPTASNKVRQGDT